MVYGDKLLCFPHNNGLGTSDIDDIGIVSLNFFLGQRTLSNADSDLGSVV